MTIQQYIENINLQYRTGKATEHSYRGDLQQLIETLAPDGGKDENVFDIMQGVSINIFVKKRKV